MWKLIWKQMQASNEEQIWCGMLPAKNLSSWILSGKRFGPVRELNPEPLAPKAKIMPLDQQAKRGWKSYTFDKVLILPLFVEPVT